MKLDWTSNEWAVLGYCPSSILCALYSDLPEVDLPVCIQPNTFMIKLGKKEPERIPFVKRTIDQFALAISSPDFAARKPERTGKHVNVYRTLDPVADQDAGKMLLLSFTIPTPSQTRSMLVTAHPIAVAKFEKRRASGVIPWPDGVKR